MVNYFFDTYAIVELLNHNPRYAEYNQHPFIITILNKIELYFWALTNYDKKFADTLINIPIQDVTNDIIQEAMLFRQKYKKRNVSNADAIGYTFARKNELLFLTGDKQFKDLPGVEFVQ